MSIVNDVCVFFGHNKCIYVKISDYLVIFRSNSKTTQRPAPGVASRKFKNIFLVLNYCTFGLRTVIIAIVQSKKK
jgi:hypothetical protein